MSVKKKPLVVVTRKLPDSIETRMRELFDARLNLDDTPMTPEQIAEAVRSADVLVPTVTDMVGEAILKDPDCKLRMIANFGNGGDNVELVPRATDTHQVSGTLTKLIGGHTIVFGGGFTSNGWESPICYASESFAGGQTGDPNDPNQIRRVCSVICLLTITNLLKTGGGLIRLSISTIPAGSSQRKIRSL